MSNVTDNSVNLVVTSPPYPMIEMWDDVMGNQNSQIKEQLKTNPQKAFELMHSELDKVWEECFRVLEYGSFLCINIGDATRSINGSFELYNNSSRIVSACKKIGFVNLPNVLWRKQTNSPNKFMGSGMLPNGAYVTLEHEWILIFRKGGKRVYTKEEDKKIRRSSSFFWEERNVWFSDLWEVKGTKQLIGDSETRERNASYPFEIPYRLINMYSQKGDVVLDPFLGLGTTTLAAIILQRNSIGYEIDTKLSKAITANIKRFYQAQPNQILQKRLKMHMHFIHERKESNKEVKYFNNNIQCPVMTNQETDISFENLNTLKIEEKTNSIEILCEFAEKSIIYQPTTLL
ncbi:MAG: site-specific DNA-methyltransferase [Paludibacteraceae bacterium]|nr:site-specific DNA-methyltransferase [Paludibacteraceae bacterium]